MNNESLISVLQSLESPEYEQQYQELVGVMRATLKAGRTIFICGNGGSHSIAQHIASEYTGRFKDNMQPLPVLALGEASHLTCVTNDFGFNDVFSRNLEAFSKPGDLLIAMSTSGNSSNVNLAINVAHSTGVSVFSLLGKGGGAASLLPGNHFVVPSGDTARIQEVHLYILHKATEEVLQCIKELEISKK